jgi:hypothetical protein
MAKKYVLGQSCNSYKKTTGMMEKRGMGRGSSGEKNLNKEGKSAPLILLRDHATEDIFLGFHHP